jgi:hypothetical protein
MIDPLTQKYLEVLNEGQDKGIVKTTLKTGSPAFGDLKTANDPEENVTLKKPVDGEHNSDDDNGEMEKCKTHKDMKENKQLNPFETLYNKILSEEDSFGWSMDKDEDETEETTEDFELSDESESDEMDDQMDDQMDDEGESEEVSFTLDKETAQKLIDVLQAAIGGGELEDEEESGEDEGSYDEDEEDIFASDEDESEEDDDEETLTKEEVDAEIVGHSLVDQEKLLKGLNNPKNGVVKGALSAKKKKANVPLTGKGFKGELSKHKESAGKSLQGKNNKVNAVNAKNKTLVDNK